MLKQSRLYLQNSILQGNFNSRDFLKRERKRRFESREKFDLRNKMVLKNMFVKQCMAIHLSFEKYQKSF